MVEPTAIQDDQGVILEPVRRTPIVREVDVLVCGGGVSGVGAALGAARAGARAMVLERNAFLGGAATAGRDRTRRKSWPASKPLVP